MAAFMEVCTNHLPGCAGAVPRRASGSPAWLQGHHRFTVANESTVPFSSPSPHCSLMASHHHALQCQTSSCLPCTLSADFSDAMLETVGMPGGGSVPPLGPLTLVGVDPAVHSPSSALWSREWWRGDMLWHLTHGDSALVWQGVRVPAFPGQSPHSSLRCGTRTIVPHWHPLDIAHPSVTRWNRNTIDLTECYPSMNVSQLPLVFVFDKCLSFGSHPPSSWGLLCCDNLLFDCHSVRCLKRIIGRYFCSLDIKK